MQWRIYDIIWTQFYFLTEAGGTKFRWSYANRDRVNVLFPSYGLNKPLCCGRYKSLNNKSTNPYCLLVARFARFDRYYLVDAIVSGISIGKVKEGENRDMAGAKDSHVCEQ